MFDRLCLAAVVGATMTAGCASSPTAPTVIAVPKTLQLMCPVTATGESASGQPVQVSYQAPTPTGGVAPITSSCAPSSGSSFVVGSTTVNCTARDTQQHTASCAFNVTVTRPGTITISRFMAFGDSITEGVIATSCPGGSSTGVFLRDFLFRDAISTRAAVNVPTSYPSVLQGLLANRYVAQPPTVTNVGLGGEFITDASLGTNDATMARLDREISTYAPQVVLLLEGVNDLNANALHPELGVPAVVKGLRDLSRDARARGASQVFVGTLLPQQTGACRAYAPNAIATANDSIRAMVAAERLTLVDIYGAFGGVPGPYLGLDGLHPNQLGYQKIAQTFFDAIKSTLEVPR
jgi:lysophospholipase L1-like esterase